MKILMVLTSHDQLGNTGRKTGFWLEELAAPYCLFRDVGVEMTLAQPKVGSPLDPNRDDPDSHAEATRHFKTLLQSRARKSRGHCFARNFPK